METVSNLIYLKLENATALGERTRVLHRRFYIIVAMRTLTLNEPVTFACRHHFFHCTFTRGALWDQNLQPIYICVEKITVDVLRRLASLVTI